MREWGEGNFMDDVVLHGATEACRVPGRCPASVDLHVAALEEDINRPEPVLLTESKAAVSCDADLGAEHWQPGQ